MIKNGIVAVGDTAQLACMIGGVPVSNVTWHLNGERLDGGRYKTFNDNGTLLIENVIIADEGTYQCVAENSLGIDHATVTLTVNGKFIDESRFFFSPSHPSLHFFCARCLITDTYYKINTKVCMHKKVRPRLKLVLD